MSCYECKCNTCANSSELTGSIFTPGECDFFCYTCDECKHYDGDWRKRTMFRRDCEKYKEPEKRRQAVEQRRVAEMRKQIYLIK